KRQFIKHLSNQTAKSHDGAAAEQKAKTELSVQFFERRRRRVADREFLGQSFAQSASQCFGRELAAGFMGGADGDETSMLKGRKLAPLTTFQLLHDVTSEI